MVSPPSTTPHEAKTSGTARWLNLVTSTVLAAVVVILVAAAAPSLVRAGMSATEEPPELAPPVRGRHLSVVPRDHPPPAFPLDDPPDDDRPRKVRPTDPRAAAPRLPGQEEEDDEPGFGLGLRGGVTAKPVPLRDRHTGTVLQEVKAGQSVSILREDGDWVLLVQRSKDDLVTGWAKRNELVLR